MARARNFKNTNPRPRTYKHTGEYIPEAKYRYLLSLLDTPVHELNDMELGLMISFLHQQQKEKEVELARIKNQVEAAEAQVSKSELQKKMSGLSVDSNGQE